MTFRPMTADEPIEPWILVVDGRASGYFQVYDIGFGNAPWPAVCAGPDPNNLASIRVLEKNGFTFAGRIDTADGPEHLMVRQREK